jgi:two-component system, NarL family, sensor histidine kinase DesK
MLRLLRARVGWFSTDSVSGIHEGNEAPQPGEGGPETSGHMIPGGQPLTRLIMLVVVCSYVTVVVLELVSSQFSSRSLALAVGLSFLAMLLVLTVCITSAAAERWSLRVRLAMLLAEGILTYFPIVILGTVWADLAGFFAGAALLLLSGWVAWTVFAAAVSSVLVLSALLSAGPFGVAYLTLATLVLGLVVFGLARLSLLIRYVHARRGELAQLAVARERMRFARDLHDLLGYSLSAITLKAELTKRLVGSNPARARDELTEVLDIARQALADVRIVATGYRHISLAKEAGSVTALLGEAGIETRVAIDCDGLDERIDSVLATVLREAVANMLVHSAARHCTIKVSVTSGAAAGCEAIRLRIANDGVSRSARPVRRSGGLENLSSRLAAVGGSLTAQVRADGWFEVHAAAPYARAADQPDSDAERRQSAGA